MSNVAIFCAYVIFSAYLKKTMFDNLQEQKIYIFTDNYLDNQRSKGFELILLDFADYLIYYTRKEVTYELLTHEYNYWRRADESILLP